MFGFLARLFKPRTVDPIIVQINNEARDRAITFWLPPPINGHGRLDHNGQGRPTNQVIPSSSPLTTPVLSSPFLPQPPNNSPFVLQGSSQFLVVESQEPEERANISAYQQLSRAPTEAYSSHDYTVQSTYPPSVSSGLQAYIQHLPPRAVPSPNQVHTLATTFSGRNHYLERTVPLPDISPSLPGTYDAVADNLESSGSPTGVEARAPQLAASRAVAIERAVPFSPPLPTPGTEHSVRREEWLNGSLMDFPIVGHEPSNGPSALFADGSRNSYELVEFVDKAQSRVFAKIEHCVDYVGPSTSRLVCFTINQHSAAMIHSFGSGRSDSGASCFSEFIV